MVLIHYETPSRIKGSQSTTGAAGEFPKATIHLIQSFLNSKEAAQTTTLSKSWRKAWLTRPNLDFDQSNHASIEKFSDFANKTLKRYELSNKKIHSFNLRMGDEDDELFYRYHRCDSATATSLIVRALKLGATRLSVEIVPPGYVLPDEVFGSETLVALSTKWCDLNPKQVIRCSRLESLSLDSFWIQSKFITRILSSCPLIRSLSLSDISYALYTNHGCDSCGYGYYSNDDDNVDVNSTYRFNDYNYRKYDGRIRPHDGLRSMVLKYVDYDTLFLADLSTRFPFLEDLTLHMDNNYGEGEIQISSPTVERLSLRCSQHSGGVRLDFPSIRTFTYDYKGSSIPRLSFISAPRGGWESRVSITYVRSRNVFRKRIGTLWFVNLRKFLKKLRRSRILSLDLSVDSKKSLDYDAEAIHGSTPREIENLTLDFEGMPSLICYALLDGLFRICRPKSITQRGGANNVDFLGPTLLEGTRVRISTPSQFMYGLNDLKEARAEIFDEALSVWRDDVALDELLNDSTTTTTPGYDVNRKVRFQLNWRQSSFRDNTATKVVQVQRPRPKKVGFEEGDYVWVVLGRKGYLRVLSRRIGPFEIVEKVHSNAYRLQIPSRVGAPDVIKGKYLVPYTGDHYLSRKHLVPYTGDHYLSSDEDEPSVNFLDTLEDDVERLAWEFIEKREHSKHFKLATYLF